MIDKIIEKNGEMKNNVNYILVGILVIAAFAIGSLYTKVKMLEKGGTPTVADKGAVAPLPDRPAPPAKVNIEVADGEHTRGSKNAKVTVVEYTDYQCPFCKRFFDETYGQLKKTYIDTGKIFFVVRDFPLTSIHPNAQKAAEAAQCAGDQNKYFEYHDKLYTTQNQWSGETSEKAKDTFKSFAKQLGLNSANFGTCLDTGKMTDKVTKSISEGSSYGVQGTPAFFINGNLLSGAQPFVSFQTQIDSELKK